MPAAKGSQRATWTDRESIPECRTRARDRRYVRHMLGPDRDRAEGSKVAA